MHDFEIFQTFQGSQNMNYSMVPAKKPERPTYKSSLGKSELNLRKSALPKRPNYQTSTNAFNRQSFFNPRSTEMRKRRGENLFQGNNSSNSYVPGATVNAESTMMWQSGGTFLRALYLVI